MNPSELVIIKRNTTGRDEFGDLLANGVYLYKVDAKINGVPIEQRKTNADKSFKKNFGKCIC